MKLSEFMKEASTDDDCLRSAIAGGHAFHIGNDHTIMVNVVDPKTGRCQTDLHRHGFLRRDRELKIADHDMVEAMCDLSENLPNFKCVIDKILSIIKVSAYANAPIVLSPILIVGPPGIGKTYFFSELTKVFGVDSEFFDMSTLSSSFVISGGDRSWDKAKAGRIFGLLKNSFYANSVVVFDEIDKISGSENYNPTGSLYSILEKQSAAKFKDEYWDDVTFDVSHMIFFATANSTENIPEPIISRFNVIEIEEPSSEDKAKIAKILAPKILAEMQWQNIIDSDISDDVANALGDQEDLRGMRRSILEAFTNAFASGRKQVELEDVMPTKNADKQKIGFLN